MIAVFIVGIICWLAGGFCGVMFARPQEHEVAALEALERGDEKKALEFYESLRRLV